MDNRIVVTGYGCITSTGRDVDSVWNAIKEGETGVDTIAQWDSHDWIYKKAGEIKNYKPRDLLSDRKLLKALSRHDVLGLYAADQAIEHSQLIPYRDSLQDATDFNDRTGVFVGAPGNKFEQQYDFLPLIAAETEQGMQAFSDNLFQTVHPMWLLRNLPNNVLAYTGIQHGFKGPNENFTNHVVGGLQAILEAFYLLKTGRIERVVVIAYDFGNDPQTYFYYGNMGILSQEAIKSFDQQRDGTILAEGAGAIVLETQAAADARNATVYGEILGGATTSEAQGILSIREDGAGLKAALEKTLRATQLQATDVGMITAHGNGTVKSDASETQAIAHVFGDDAIPVTGFKWSIGHTLAASGVIETILTLCALREGIVPGIVSLNDQAKDCDRIKVSRESQTCTSPMGIIINRGFGSLSVCLAIQNS